MKTNSQIKIIVNRLEHDSEPETTELTTPGKFWMENGNFNISYEETEATGFKGCITTITATNDFVIIKRTGEYSSELLMRPGKPHHSHYDTPLGSFDVTTHAEAVSNKLTLGGGTLYLKYSLHMGGAFLDVTRLVIEVTPDEKRITKNASVKEINKI